MILGKTYAETWASAQQERLWFAWHPVRLTDGRVAWLERVVKSRDPYYTWRYNEWTGKS